jgi:hypothetical protein
MRILLERFKRTYRQKGALFFLVSPGVGCTKKRLLGRPDVHQNVSATAAAAYKYVLKDKDEVDKTAG